MGGSIGIAMLTTLLVRRTDFHRSVVSEKVTSYSGESLSRLQSLAGVFTQQGFSASDARDRALHMLGDVVNQQAMVISYEDLSYMLGVA